VEFRPIEAKADERTAEYESLKERRLAMLATFPTKQWAEEEHSNVPE
jgi:hypothetical protein